MLPAGYPPCQDDSRVTCIQGVFHEDPHSISCITGVGMLTGGACCQGSSSSLSGVDASCRGSSRVRVTCITEDPHSQEYLVLQEELHVSAAGDPHSQGDSRISCITGVVLQELCSCWESSLSGRFTYILYYRSWHASCRGSSLSG